MQARVTVCICCLYFATVSSAVSALLPQHHDGSYPTNTAMPCGLELIWPPPNAQVLLATDSRYIQVHLKLWGNCSEFLREKTDSRPRYTELHVDIFVYDPIQARQTGKFQAIAVPIVDSIPSILALANSPLLSSAISESGSSSDESRSDRPWDTTGRHDKSFSIWSVHLSYAASMLNTLGNHAPHSTSVVFEFHLISNFSKPVSSTAEPRLTALSFALLGHPSTHFHPVAARYNTLPGYVCMSSCGKMCTHQMQPRIPLALRIAHLKHSPVCLPIKPATNWTLTGPSFTMLRGVNIYSDDTSADTCDADRSCPGKVAFVSIGDDSGQEIGVIGPGRHRLLSVIADVITDSSVGFVFLKTQLAGIDHSRVVKMIRKSDLASSYAFVAFHHRRFEAMKGVLADRDVSLPLPTADFGSIEDGILVSRAAAVVMMNAAIDEVALHHNETIPAACSEFLVFSDAWLCWCAASLDIPAINMRFRPAVAGAADGANGRGDCAATSPLYFKLLHLYEQHQLSPPSSLSAPFTERTTLGFRYFMQTLAFHLIAGPRILHIPDREQRGATFFWDACCGQLLLGYMLPAVPVYASLHPLLQRSWNALAAAPNRSAFVAVLRGALVAEGIDGRDIVNASMHSVRKRMRMSVSAARVLGCSVQSSGSFDHTDGDLLRGKSASSSHDYEPLQLNVITPAVMLSKLSRSVSRQLYLATHSDWSSVFGYNPLFSKDASLAFAAPDFGVQDWHLVCLLAVLSMTGSGAPPVVDVNSREHLACNAFASAVWQRTYAAGMPRCFDTPPRVAGEVRYSGSARAHSKYLSNCQAAGDEGREVHDDPWMLRQLAGAVQALLLERWDALQV
jgi:hypothetical protein